MSLIQRATLPQEYIEWTSARLLMQPEPQYLHAILMKAALGASFPGVSGFGAAGHEFNPGGAPYTQPGADRLVLSDGIFDQTFSSVAELGKTPGHTIRMNRPAYTNTTYTQASRELPSGTLIDTNPSKVGSEQVSITLRRFGGPYNSATGKVGPIGIDRFDGDFMMHKPAQIVSLHLARDFDRFLDAVGVSLLDQADTILYPNANITTDDGFLQAGDAPFTWQMLQAAETQLDLKNIPRFANGKRACVLHPIQVEQLGNDPSYQRLVRYYEQKNPIFQGNYVADCGNWTIFKSVTLSKPNNANSVPVYRAQAFGPGAVGIGMGMMPRVANRNEDNFGETAYLIWLMYAGFEVFDTRFIASLRSS